MDTTTTPLSDATKARLSTCTSAQEAVDVILDAGLDLSDDQLESVVGGVSNPAALNNLVALLSDTLANLLPEGLDPSAILSNVSRAAR